MKRFLRQAQRWLYLIHRWIGIATCLLFAMWFFSGVVMMYVGFPALTETERRSLLPVIDGQQLRLSPTDALAAAGLSEWPRGLRLEMLAGEPVYRIAGWNDARLTISARDGRRIEAVDAARAVAVVQRVRPAPKATTILEDRDQWSVTARYDSLRPFYLVSLNDPAGTQLYVSSRTGEIALDTTRSERFWNWLGSVPHWIYPTVLRRDAPLWRDVVLWLSGPAIAVAITGIWIGIQRLRPQRRYSNGAISPYRGWMLWHHWAGIIGSVFLLAWIISGWISMNPNNWFSGRNTEMAALQRYAGHTAADFPIAVVPENHAVELRFLWVGGTALVMQYRADSSGAGQPLLESAAIFTAATALMPDACAVLRDILTEEDAYWYSHHTTRTLPVLRIGFDDPDGTWFHIDPQSGEILNRMDDSRRSYRWLFNALHSFDFRILLSWRPAWDILLWGMSIIGFAASISGVVIGWRHLRRKIDR
ncbi:PepSY domain-containing protein [Ferrovibrio terrae]|uniref:PepSY domain-containing protein n=1 Tax=Ferrovibrio terrae TaxID=2594003 RepID=A0A516H321_9PROT|nr:PepSY domain-containing protein [Ferrovibrio terrae]QDO98176.1 PepSY domain-containing protein [Ferrovibrio terrae]